MGKGTRPASCDNYIAVEEGYGRIAVYRPHDTRAVLRRDICPRIPSEPPVSTLPQPHSVYLDLLLDGIELARFAQLVRESLS